MDDSWVRDYRLAKARKERLLLVWNVARFYHQPVSVVADLPVDDLSILVEEINRQIKQTQYPRKR